MANGRLNASEILSVQQRRFLHGGDAGASEETEKSKTKRANRRSEPVVRGAVISSSAGGKERTRAVQTGMPSEPASVARGMGLKSVTLRLNPEIARALRRAAAERTVDYVEPFTQQAIAETALIRWLTDEGYAIDA